MSTSEPNPTRRDFLLATASVAAAGAAASASPVLAQTDDHASDKEKYDIIALRDGIWRTQDDRHNGLLIETDEGMIVFDSINLEFATWLNSEIGKRFNKPVKWVVYSHNHSDHVSGGQAFAEHNPRYISQQLARNSMERMKVDTRLPDETFKDRFDIYLGGRKVELRYHGPNDGHGSISLFVPDQQLLSAIDWLLIGRLPYRDLARYDVEGTIRSLHDIEQIDWTLAAPGHADVGDKAGMRVVRRYYESIRDGVVQSLVEEQTLADLIPVLRQELADDAEFAALAQFDNWVDLNITGIHAQIARMEGYMDG